jgi:hypothetical protein
MRQTLEFSPGETGALSRQGEGHGEVQRIHGEAIVTDSFACDEIEIAAETVAGCALYGAESPEQGPTVKVMRVDADDGAEDVGAVLEDLEVLAQGIDMAHGLAVYTSKGSQGQHVQSKEHLGDEFDGE